MRSASSATTPTGHSTRASPATASRRTGFGGYQDGGAAVAVQGDGKIVAVGHAGGIYTDFALARYNPNGTLDPGFSGDGKQTTDFGGDDEAAAVAVQANGKIVAVGKGHPRGIGFEPTFALARYDPDGSLDPSFDGNGKQTTAIGGVWQLGDRGRDSAERQDRRGWLRLWRQHCGLRDRPLQPERLAGHDLLRRRQAGDGLRGRGLGDRCVDSGRRQDRGGWRRRHNFRQRLRARPLQPQRVAGYDLLWGWKADDRLRQLRRRSKRGSDPSERQDRGCRRWRSRRRARSLQPQRDT